MGCHFLLQGILPTQGLNPGLLHCRRILYHPSHQATIKIHSKVSLKHLLCALDCSRPRVPDFGGQIVSIVCPLEPSMALACCMSVPSNRGAVDHMWLLGT